MENKLTRRFCFWTADELLRAYKSKTLSPKVVVEDILERIQQVNDKVNAYCFVEEKENLLKQAEESEARYLNGNPLPLDGIPVSVKDLLTVKGWKTYFGSKAYTTQRLELAGNNEQALIDQVDSPSVEHARKAGCIFIGKVTSPEFGWEGVTLSPMTGITRNPFDFNLSSGGSSGGSSAALGLGMAPLSIGSDAAGSVRIPASMCMVSSIKPTVSMVPHAPASPFGTMSNIGPMAMTIKDVALFLDIIAQPHPWDPLSIHPSSCDGNSNHVSDLYDSPPRKYSDDLEGSIQGLRIGMNFSLSAYCDPEIEKAVRQAAKVFEELGAIVEEVPELPFQKESENLDIFGSFKVLWCTGGATVVNKRIKPEYQHLVDENLQKVASRGRFYTAYDLNSAEMTRTTMTAVMNQQFFTKYDILMTPTLPITAFEAELETCRDESIVEKLCGFHSSNNMNSSHSKFLPPCQSPYFEKEFDMRRWWMFCQYTYPMNMMKLPAASVPCGKFMGLHIVGPQYAERLVLKVAHAFQSHTDFVPDLSKNCC
ncbi:hypothetical protein FDP41_001499 [Naegleria fowleri]|uniref:Amidase domain-containing protein n=1 Tax=Naegleria fowleri TaxID=5763 RepID=A0A6A5BV66_NAEFO|nr:uncharacterized protein FDP41_001499 [Naegleria fowleri]KAF0979156.1 hypothetical protein FDP41_001499 [Naegleria fowleri]CAG4708352.1 unnamed protein product [Naegleria fowleri]